MSTDAWGIDDGWTDTSGAWRGASPDTIAAIRAVMADPTAGRPVWVVRPGEARDLDAPGHLRLEDGTDLGRVRRLPSDLPLGLHDLVDEAGDRLATVLVGPGRCHLPADLRGWGVAVQVPTTRSRGSWGIGDLADVRAVAGWLHDAGGRVLALSPLHAPTPVLPIATSPYFPSSRRWRSPLLIRVDEVPGAKPPAAALATRARDRLASSLVDRDACWTDQRLALHGIWSELPDDERDRLERWRADQGEALEGWTRYCALAEVHGPDWRSWPRPLRHPSASAVEQAAAALAPRRSFHAWLQLVVDDQLEAVRKVGVRVVQDLAIGVDPGGADAWLWQDLLATGFSIGAPPDDFAPNGQRWGLPPWVPVKLRDAGYRPLADLLRASLVAGGGLRIDHAMGLSRLFWIPDGGTPADGAYVRFDGHHLLELVAMESARAGAVVVGEDLGTVERGFREALAATAILSTRLVWFEHDPPESWPRQAFAMVTTHDLPTVAGVCTGVDSPPPMRANLEHLVGPVAGRPTRSVAVEVHRRLGRSPAMLVLATMEDLLGVVARPNQPGTLADERPNWSVALPVLVDDLAADPDSAEILAALAEGRAVPDPAPS